LVSLRTSRIAARALARLFRVAPRVRVNRSIGHPVLANPREVRVEPFAVGFLRLAKAFFFAPLFLGASVSLFGSTCGGFGG